MLELGTEKPIEGAAVLVVYNKGVMVQLLSYYSDSYETLTDKDGRFRIPMNLEINITPLTYFESDPSIIIFKPGYGCYPSHKGIKTSFGGVWPMPHEPVTIWLPSVRGESLENRLKNAACLPSPSVPDDAYIKLQNLRIEEYKSLGVK